MQKNKLDPEWVKLADAVAELTAERLSGKPAEIIVPEYLSPQQCARLFSFTTSWLETMRYRDGGPPYVKTPTGQIKYNRRAVEAWINSRTTGT